MPFTIITLRNSTPSLRGDLSKWMQEIATGVYVGNFNSRIRDKLWKRVMDSVGNGEATMCFACRNEIGYDFKTFNSNRDIINVDGLPLICIPKKNDISDEKDYKGGFSDAFKFKQSKKLNINNKNVLPGYVVLDIETDGTDPISNSIIEIGAIKYENGNCYEFSYLIKNKQKISTEILKLTGITNQMLENDGANLSDVLPEFRTFICDLPIVGYNVNFDINFINSAFEKINEIGLMNRVIDLLPLVKKENMFLENYRLETVLLEYGIEEEQKHRALSDAKQTMELATKLKKFYSIVAK